jgi:hypothetical protein
LVAEVGVGVEYDAPSKGTPYQKVLGHHFAGRARPFTKFEGAEAGRSARQRAGCGPWEAAQLDAFGNLSTGTIVKLMSILRLFSGTGLQRQRDCSRPGQAEKVGSVAARVAAPTIW